MKIFFAFSLLVLSLSTFASAQPLLLDASCKVTCLLSVTEIENDQGTPTYKRQYEKTYTEIVGLTREQIDMKTQSVELDKLCKKAFTEKTISESIDCLYFKH